MFNAKKHKQKKNNNNFTEYKFNALVSEMKETSHFYVVKNNLKMSTKFICKAHEQQVKKGKKLLLPAGSELLA